MPHNEADPRNSHPLWTLSLQLRGSTWILAPALGWTEANSQNSEIGEFEVTDTRTLGAFQVQVANIQGRHIQTL